MENSYVQFAPEEWLKTNQKQEPPTDVILSELEREDNFCYLGDTVNGGGGSELVVTRRVGLDWKAFNTMSSMLCGKRYTWNLKGRIYRVYVRPVTTYGSETQVVRSVEEDTLRRVERRIVRKMCGVKLADRINTVLRVDGKILRTEGYNC